MWYLTMLLIWTSLNNWCEKLFSVCFILSLEKISSCLLPMSTGLLIFLCSFEFDKFLVIWDCSPLSDKLFGNTFPILWVDLVIWIISRMCQSSLSWCSPSSLFLLFLPLLLERHLARSCRSVQSDCSLCSVGFWWISYSHCGLSSILSWSLCLVYENSLVLFFYTCLPIDPIHLLKKLFFLHLIFFWVLLNIIWP